MGGAKRDDILERECEELREDEQVGDAVLDELVHEGAQKGHVHHVHHVQHLSLALIEQIITIVDEAG